MTELSNIKLVETENKLLSGDYEGVWGGYVVRFQAEGLIYEGQTNIGIRTMAAPCIVTITEKGATVRTV